LRPPGVEHHCGALLIEVAPLLFVSRGSISVMSGRGLALTPTENMLDEGRGVLAALAELVLALYLLSSVIHSMIACATDFSDASAVRERDL
jgi:hypothetical protein